MTEAAAESILPALPSATTDHTTLVLPVPGVHTATPLSLACTNFALQMVCLMGPKFNLRRDVNDVLTATGVHLHWPIAVLQRFQRYLANRNKDFESWRGVGELTSAEFLSRHGNWNGLYDDSSIFYYVDEYVKQNGKDVLAVFQTTAEASGARVKKSRILLADNIEMLGNVLGLTAAEQRLLYHGALLKVQRELRAVLV
ncbi:MAG: ATPase, partial [Burkholderiales bacterium]